MYQFGTQSRKVLNTVNKYLVLTAEHVIEKSKIDISVPLWGGLRSADYQNSLYLKKWSQADGYQVISYHQKTDDDGKSLALDLCGYYKGEQTWNYGRLGYIMGLMSYYFDLLKIMGQIPDDLYLHCGGFWTPKKGDEDGIGWDAAHYSISNRKQVIKV